MTSKRTIWLFLIESLFVSSVLAKGPELGQPPFSIQTSRKQAPAYKLWQEDLRQIARELPKLHKNAFFRISKQKWLEIVNASIQRIGPKTDISQFTAELLRVCAALGDGHTQLDWTKAHLAQVPVHFFRFSDGVFVTFFPKDKPELKAAKVLRIGNQPIGKVLQRLRSFIPAENEAYFSNSAMLFLSFPSLLKAFGIQGDSQKLKIGIQVQGQKMEVDVQSLPFGQRPKGGLATSFDKIPVFLGRARQKYAFKLLQKGQALYFQYNRCKDLRGMEQLVKELAKKLRDKHLKTFIIDLRRNGGGSSLVISPLLSFLILNKHKCLQGTQLYCLIGRRTFSSALLNAMTLKQKFHAILVGEPTGGKPNHYGEIKPLRLRNSHLTLYYSTKFFKRVKGDPDSLMPDHAIPLLSKEIFKGEDAALRYCLEEKGN